MRRLIVFGIALAACIMGKAQLTASSMFCDAPSTVLPLLDRNTRLDMVDYFNSGSSTSSKNVMQGQSRVTSLTPMSLTASLTGSSQCQIALLPFKGDTAVVYIETVLAPAPDSRVKVFDRKWNLISSASFQMPDIDEWMNKNGDKNAAATAKSLVPFMLASAEYTPDTQTLTLTNRLSDFLSPDVDKQVGGAMLPTLTYKWDGNRFKREK